MSKKQKYYVIWAGHKTGIFDTWAETEQNIKGFQNAQFKSFETKEQAEEMRLRFEINSDSGHKYRVKKIGDPHDNH